MSNNSSIKLPNIYEEKALDFFIIFLCIAHSVGVYISLNIKVQKTLELNMHVTHIFILFRSKGKHRKKDTKKVKNGEPSQGLIFSVRGVGG